MGGREALDAEDLAGRHGAADHGRVMVELARPTGHRGRLLRAHGGLEAVQALQALVGLVGRAAWWRFRLVVQDADGLVALLLERRLELGVGARGVVVGAAAREGRRVRQVARRGVLHQWDGF